MSEIGTTQADQSSPGEIIPVNPAPDHKSDAEQDESGAGNTVIPAILAIVLAVVVVATFFEDEYKNLLVVLGLSDDETVSEVLAADESAQDLSATDTTGNTLLLNQTDDDDMTISAMAPDQEQSTGSNLVNTTTGSTAKITGVDETAAPAVPPSPTTSSRSPYVNPDSNPYYASPDYGTPYQAYAYPDSKEQMEMIAQQRRIWEEIEDQRRRDWEEMMEYRRQVWLEAEAARREHLKNMHSIRTAVLKRIEQDHEDMHRQMQKMDDEMNKRRERSEQHMLEFGRREDRIEI